MKKALRAGLILVIALCAAFLVPTLWFKPWFINHFYTRVFLEFALRRPMLLSQLRILEPLGLDFHSDDLDDASVEFELEEAKWLDRQRGILRSYGRASMSASDGLSYDALEWYMADAQELNRFMFYDYPVNQMGGVQTTLPEFMTDTHQINNSGDAEDYLDRLSKFGVFFDQVIEGLRHREKVGIVPPRFVVEKSLAQMTRFVAEPPISNPLYTHFKTKVDALSDVDAEERAEMLERAQETIGGTVYPAYARLAEYCGHLAQVANAEDGVWRFPDGKPFYQQLLRHHTTTNMTPDEIHQLGLAEVSTLQSEMRAILNAQGIPSEDVGASMAALSLDPRFLYPETDDGRQQLLTDFQRIVDDVDRNLGSLFNLRPKIGVKVERMQLFREADAPSAYYDPPPFDGSKPGTFYVNLRTVKLHPKFGMRTLAYHEAIPGHHFQITIAQELTGVPFFRKVIPFSAHVEGWALYAERLAAEHGFEDDPYDRLGYLTSQLFRAVRLVVDTGIHSKRWTREQAIEYMLKNTGMPESDVVSEIERYIVLPGQACAYEVGQLKILQLREQAQKRLGPKFDLREFHRVLLSNGALPLTVLERLVDEWITSRT
ncbi:MAG: DUF885 domain-containing protein [Acidobacteriota bacterium]